MFHKLMFVSINEKKNFLEVENKVDLALIIDLLIIIKKHEILS